MLTNGHTTDTEVIGIHRGTNNFMLNSFLASDSFHRLLITFANSLDPDQDRQNVGLDLDPNCLTLKEFFSKKFILKKVSRSQQKHKKYPACNELKVCLHHIWCQWVNYLPTG